MKLLIDADIVKVVEANDDPQVDQDFWDEITDVLKERSVWYSLTKSESGRLWYFSLLAQKINLGEKAMNELFADAFFFFKYEIRYAALGGSGCDFSLSLKSLPETKP